MPNSFFQFKQFRIEQNQTAMKVCTDACVLGAYAEVSGASQILDIGTGTGLLALMLAQRDPEAIIQAVEIEENAYQQAMENVKNSPWANRIQVIHASIQHFNSSHPFDLIISNPPFYQNHLKRAAKSQNLALHSEALSLLELAQSVHRLLANTGRFVVMLPPHQAVQLENVLDSQGLYPIDKLRLHDYTGGKLIRCITTYAYSRVNCPSQELSIKGADGQYTEAFVQLLKPYYLYL